MVSLKETFERIRGEQIVTAPPPTEIPCYEISNEKLLCKAPVVSIVMTTYNHEQYIAQAIESIVSQKTSFEYELLIGEDASTDNTKAICLSYQKRFPEKIRIFWSEKNVNAYGGNHIRVESRCRGEFLAFCEGDDYWFDVNKLQKQVDVMRSNDTLAFCWGKALVIQGVSGPAPQSVGESKYQIFPGLMIARMEKHIATCTTLIRSSLYNQAKQRYEIFSWHLMLGDKQIWIALGLVGDACFINDYLSVYRVHPLGVTHAHGAEVSRDGGIVSLYFSHVAPQELMCTAPAAVMEILKARLIRISCQERLHDRIENMKLLLSDVQIADALYLNFGLIGCWCALIGKRSFRLYNRVVWFFRKRFRKLLPR